MTQATFTTQLNHLTSEALALWYLPGMSPAAPQWPQIVALAQAMKELIEPHPEHYEAHRKGYAI